MAEEPDLSPHPYKHDAWFMLGYLRQCIASHGAISTTDWLEALKRSRISQTEEQETRQVAAEAVKPAKCANCGAPARNDGSDYDGMVCEQWPLCQSYEDCLCTPNNPVQGCPFHNRKED